MLIVFRVLALGGIETFIIRLAKERFRQGLRTKVLLLTRRDQNDPEMLVELEKYAEIEWANDILYGGAIPIFSELCLVRPFKKNKIVKLLDGITHIHVCNGLYAHFALRIKLLLSNNVGVTIGIYHIKEFLWGDSVPYFEQLNRKLIFDVFPKEKIIFFSDNARLTYIENKYDVSRSTVFPLGVIDFQDGKLILNKTRKLQICSVGRLVGFKQYNLWMIDVVKKLLDRGYEVIYDIYGEGDLQLEMQEKIKNYGLSHIISLKGNLKYSEFNEKISKYDIFVGSGTAITQASALGVCSIVGLESFTMPLAKGYFCDHATEDFYFNGNVDELIQVFTLIEKYIQMHDEEKLNIKVKHLKIVDIFGMTECSDNFNKLEYSNFNYSLSQKKLIKYELSRLKSQLMKRLYKHHPLNFKYD